MPTANHGWPVTAEYDAPACVCCCYDHTFGWGCPAYAWGTCRGQGSVEEREYFEWFLALKGWTREDEHAAVLAARRVPNDEVPGR